MVSQLGAPARPSRRDWSLWPDLLRRP